MPIFEYTATDAEGRIDRGAVIANDLAAAAVQLGQRGLTVQTLGMAGSAPQPMAQAPVTARPEVSSAEDSAPPVDPRPYFQSNVVGALVGGVPLSALHFFFKQLGTMLNAGINPVDGLDTLNSQTSHPKLKKVIEETRGHVLAGRPMSAGFQRYPEVFSPLMLSMIRVGERGGLLAEQCTQLSEYIKRDLELRNLIRRETAYPKMVIGASVIIIMGANAVISSVTKANQTEGNFQIQAPIFIWIGILVATIAGFLFVRLGLRQQAIKHAWDQFLLLIPGIRGMVIGFAMAKFGRAFGALYRSGVPFGEGLKLAADACGNEALRSRIYPAVEKIETGQGITESLRETRAFSPIVMDMTSTGERTGNLDEMLEKASEFYEDEGQTQSRKAAAILGIVALLVVGGYVLYIAVTFFTTYGQRLDTGG